eukprot:g5615.t1
MGGIVPQTYIDMFQPFLNDIPARDMADIRRVIEGELGDGRTIEDVFATFNETPIGTASIGQAHRATLKGSGRRVVVKVQNPEAERTFRGDVFALKVLVDAFMPQISVAFDEIQKQFATEFDYRGEVRNQLDVRANLRKAGFDVIVPEVVEELCSQRLMVMEEIYPATPLHDQLNIQAEKMAHAKGMTKQEFLDAELARVKAEEDALAKEGKLRANVSSSDYDKYIALQRGKRGTSRALKHAWNWTLGLLPGLGGGYDMSDAADDVGVPLNAARLIDELLEVHGHEALIDGCFNADPHPGNILCVGGKLALIDYGQVKRLTDQQRYDLAKSMLLVEAAIDIDPRANRQRTMTAEDEAAHAAARRSVVDHARATGMQTEKNLDDTYYEMMCVYLGRMDKAFLYPENALQWTDRMQDTDPMGAIDKIDYLVMINMTTMMLRGFGEALQQYRNVAKAWAPYARKALAEREGELEKVEREIASWKKAAADETPQA